MAVFYLDSSALLKRYRTEKGTGVVDAIYDNRSDEHFLVTSQLTCVEVESVAARARKAGLLNIRAYGALLASFARDISEGVRVIPIDHEALVGAAESVREVPLRSLDAIHYSVVKRMHRRHDAATHHFVFVGSDRELLDACEHAKINTLDPEAENAVLQLSHYWERKPE